MDRGADRSPSLAEGLDQRFTQKHRHYHRGAQTPEGATPSLRLHTCLYEGRVTERSRKDDGRHITVGHRATVSRTRLFRSPPLPPSTRRLTPT